MIERVLNAQQLRPGLPVFLWAIGVALAGKVAAASGSAAAIMGWQAIFLFLLPVIMPLRYLLATILAVIVFLDASLWFLQGDFPTNTVYESNGAFVKPPEFLALALVLRLILLRDLPDTIPKFFTFSAFFWIAVIIMGGFTALFLQRPISDILIFSEMRSPIVMALFALMLAPLITISPRFFIDTYAVLILVHFGISLASWLTGFSLLWPSYAPNYIGGHTAFFGADESVIVYLLANAIALALLVSPPDRDISGFGKKFWMVIFILSAFAILASLRRGGVGAMAIAILTLFIFSGLRIKLRFLVVFVVLGPLLFGVTTQTGVLDGLMSRLAGEGSTAVSNAGRVSDFLEGMGYVSDNIWFGTGSGTRISLSRTQAYGVYDSLSVHNAILHVWARFGALGFITYCLVFLSPIIVAFLHSRRCFWPQAVLMRNLCLAMSGLLLALFIWTLLTPPIYLNFRQGGVWAMGVGLVFAAIARQKMSCAMSTIDLRSRPKLSMR